MANRFHPECQLWLIRSDYLLYCEEDLWMHEFTWKKKKMPQPVSYVFGVIWIGILAIMQGVLHNFLDKLKKKKKTESQRIVGVNVCFRHRLGKVSFTSWIQFEKMERNGNAIFFIPLNWSVFMLDVLRCCLGEVVSSWLWNHFNLVSESSSHHFRPVFALHVSSAPKLNTGLIKVMYRKCLV